MRTRRPSREKAEIYVRQIEAEHRLTRLGDTKGFAHLNDSLRAFLDDHAEPSRNVFLMMRFERSVQLDLITAIVRAALTHHGLVGLRADDREYAEELWANLETYMLGCSLGIAVSEQIDRRDLNPNVSLELGFMLARHGAAFC